MPTNSFAKSPRSPGSRTLPAGKIAVTVDLHVNFLAHASGTTLVAKARALQVGSTICVVAVELETDAPTGQRLCAVATASLRVVDMPPLPAAP